MSHVAVRASITATGDGPHPTSVRAMRIAVAAPDKAEVTDDNRLCALVDDDAQVRLGAQSPELDVPRKKPKRSAADVILVGRAPYYRTGAVLAGLGGLLIGIAYANGGGLRELKHHVPDGWAGVAGVYGLFFLVGSSAIAAGRVPFELDFAFVIGKHA